MFNQVVKVVKNYLIRLTAKILPTAPHTILSLTATSQPPLNNRIRLTHKRPDNSETKHKSITGGKHHSNRRPRRITHKLLAKHNQPHNAVPGGSQRIQRHNTFLHSRRLRKRHSRNTVHKQNNLQAHDIRPRQQNPPAILRRHNHKTSTLQKSRYHQLCRRLERNHTLGRRPSKRPNKRRRTRPQRQHHHLPRRRRILNRTPQRLHRKQQHNTSQQNEQPNHPT
jgi:hypothetical protein